MEVFAHMLRVGDVVDGEPIYRIVNHPSGIAVFDVFDELIDTFNRDQIVLMEIW
jgi:hypothetical protein